MRLRVPWKPSSEAGTPVVGQVGRGKAWKQVRDRKTKTKVWDQAEVPKIRHDNRAIREIQEAGGFSCKRPVSGLKGGLWR